MPANFTFPSVSPGLGAPVDTVAPVDAVGELEHHSGGTGIGPKGDFWFEVVFRQKTHDEVVFAEGAGDGAVRNQTIDEVVLVEATDELVALDQILVDVMLAKTADEVVKFAQTTCDGAVPVEIPDDGAGFVQTIDIVPVVDVRFTHGGPGALFIIAAFEVELISVVSVAVTVSVAVEWSMSSTSQLEERL